MGTIFGRDRHTTTSLHLPSTARSHHFIKMNRIILIASVLVGVASANNCANPMVAPLLVPATLAGLLRCSGESCNMNNVAACPYVPNCDMDVICPATPDAVQCVLNGVGGNAVATAVAQAGIVPGLTVADIQAADDGDMNAAVAARGALVNFALGCAAQAAAALAAQQG